MKNKFKLPLVALLLPFLFACASSGGSSSSDSIIQSSDSSTLSSDSQSSSSSESSSEESSSSSSVEKDPLNGTFNFYAVNDFHGSIVEQEGDSGYEGGILKVFGKLKELKDADPEHTFIISSGDMFQGSLESNHFYGMSVLEAMNYVGFDSMTYGNHEFDYGQERLNDLREAANFPFLGGNIVLWDHETGKKTSNAWEYGQASTIIERGGVKVGIVGMIGSGQTTSITSKYVQDLHFDIPNNYIKTEATRLREEEGCDIVILSLHNNTGSVSLISNLKDYIDGGFFGHTHVKENKISSDGVPLIQGQNNGSYISHFTLEAVDGEITCTNYENIKADESWAEDAGLATIMDKYIGTEEFETLANKELATMDGSLNKYQVADLGCKAIYEKYKDYDNDGENDIVCAIMNSQRNSIGTANQENILDYSQLYKATPFMNDIVILNALGSTIMSVAGNNRSYCGEYELYETLDKDTYYEIAVIDYMAYHQNSSKQYDMFSSMADASNIKAEYVDYPFDIISDYCINDLNGVLQTSTIKDGAGYNIW